MNLEQRMARLERENRIHRGLWGAAIVIGLALVVWGHAQPIPEVNQARRFDVLDRTGQITVFLGTTSADRANMNPSGTLLLRNKLGRQIISIAGDDFGHGKIQVCHSSGNTCKNFQYAPE